MSIRPEQKYGDEYAKLLKYLTEEAGLNLNSAKQHLIDVANDLIEPKYGLEAIFEPQAVKTVENTPEIAENTPEIVEVPKKRGGRPKKQV